MQNIKYAVKGNTLTVEIDITKSFGDSKSGKTTIIASTGGNQAVALPDGRQIKLGVNCYQGK